MRRKAPVAFVQQGCGPFGLVGSLAYAVEGTDTTDVLVSTIGSNGPGEARMLDAWSGSVQFDP